MQITKSIIALAKICLTEKKSYGRLAQTAVHIQDGKALVTNSYSLIELTLPSELKNEKYIIPGEDLAKVKVSKHFDLVDVSGSTITFDHAQYNFKKCDSEFPAYQNLFPETDRRVHLTTSLLIQVLETLKKIDETGSDSVTLSFSGDPLKPIVFTQKNSRALLMPRLQ